MSLVTCSIAWRARSRGVLDRVACFRDQRGPPVPCGRAIWILQRGQGGLGLLKLLAGLLAGEGEQCRARVETGRLLCRIGVLLVLLALDQVGHHGDCAGGEHPHVFAAEPAAAGGQRDGVRDR
jgi:hypothetical protein